MSKTTAGSPKLSRMEGIVTRGRVAWNSCRLGHGTVIPPMLTPTKNQALTRPVMETRCSAYEIVVEVLSSVLDRHRTCGDHRRGVPERIVGSRL